MCENSGPGREAGISEPDRTQIHLNSPVLHRLGLRNNNSISWQIGALADIGTGMKVITWPFGCALSGRTCGAIARKRDPGAGEGRPRDPSAAA